MVTRQAFHGLRLLSCTLALAASVVHGQVAPPAPSHAAWRIDFEKSSAGQDWSTQRSLEMAQIPVPMPQTATGDGPHGKGLAITTQGEAGLFLRSGQGPTDWNRCSEISFWLHRAPETTARRPVSVIEVQVYEKDGRARFWRKVEVDHSGWKQFRLPLKWFRWGSGRVPRWTEADRMGFWFRDAADVVLDTLVVQQGEADRASELTSHDVRRIAFPSSPENQIVVVEHADVRIITDAKDLDAQQLAAHLSQVSRQVCQELALQRPSISPLFVIFADEQAYRDFPPRLARNLNSVSPQPTAGGYTLHGISTSYWDPRQGTLRPVYTHEFVHGLIARTVGVANSGEWFQEGIANYFQIRFHPQDNLDKIVREGLADPQHRWPLATLCRGKPLPANRYWQALTVVDLLLHDARYATGWPKLIAEIGNSGATDLEPLLPEVFESDWDQLNDAWLAHCRAKYGG